MKIEELQNKKILIVGYGMEGKATEEFLKLSIPNLNYAIADVSQGEDYLQNQHEFDIAIRSPSVNKKILTIPHTTSTNIFFANLTEHITIGVTGTKGKSTTASLIAHILKSSGKEAKVVGNIGNPLITELLHKPPEKTIYVCELSSYQLDDIQYSPHISVIVSLFPDHLNYHGSLEAYFNAKKNLILHAKPEDYYVYNPTFPLLADWVKETQAEAKSYETDFIPKSPLLGQHNKDNMRAAITVCRLFDITDAEIQNAVSIFTPLPHRLEFVGTFNKITFYDDAISTTPESTMAALQSIPNVKTIFLGG
ncbi:MAG TPA: Mur ligase family protein, partial [Candidatus Woesebacteria bacterium]|nr:Mur ligase family protein [Candidatus Woesebacteria bacterium]